jgi:hypothetical protein
VLVLAQKQERRDEETHGLTSSPRNFHRVL